MNIKISKGNSKMGQIPSVSLPAGLTCRPDCACYKKCYARRLENLRPNVKNAYRVNYDVLNNDEDTYWREVEASIMASRFFRYHVSGDIPDNKYFLHMVQIAERNAHCEMLCFTKKYNIVNEFLKTGKKIPDNLHILFSAWDGMKMENPYHLPEAHVSYKNGVTTARSDAIPCSGNCTECAITDGGCWSLKNGQQILLKEH